jgi:hypothetical protein
VTALQTHNNSMNDKMDEILKHLKAKKWSNSNSFSGKKFTI